MKVLLDACVWGKAVPALEQEGHDASWAGEWRFDPGDEAILAIASKENRVLVTLDKDFGELAIRRGQRHRGIVRLVGIPAKTQAEVCAQVLIRFSAELQGGALIVAELGRVRVRLPG
ncbi:MAG: DUF5615 family PIN-like protein [Burkholderiales bacterium]